MCVLGFDTTWCTGPIISQKYKFSCCSSHCLDPVVAIVTAVELDGISYKFVQFQVLSSSLTLIRRYRAHAMASHAQDCPDWSPAKTHLPLE